MDRIENSKTAAVAGLKALAILSVNSERLGRDYIENFVPLAVECLREMNEVVVASEKLRSALKERFGLEIPHHAITTILHRASRQGYVTVDHYTYRINREKCDESKFFEIEKNVSRSHDAVVHGLTKYAREVHGAEWTVEEAQKALLGFLADEDAALLTASVGERVLMVPEAVPRDSRFIVSSFILAVKNENFQLYNLLEILAKGHMLANALFLPDQGAVQRKFVGTTAYLDTTLLVFALGYAGVARREPATEVLNLLKTYGADIACLEITVNEIQGILAACAHRIKSGRKSDYLSSTMEYFIEQGMNATDIELELAKLDTNLKYIGIEVLPSPQHEARFQIDEIGLQECLMNGINYRRKEALLHDVDAISSTVRLRKGLRPIFVESCRAIFVTTNSALARLSREYLRKEEGDDSVPVCVTDYAIANLLWLKNPRTASQLPAKRMLASAYAALQPPVELWKVYLARIEDMRSRHELTEYDTHLLRYSLAARTALMERTHGVLDGFTSGTVVEVLAVAEAAARQEVEDQLRSEREQRIVAENLVVETEKNLLAAQVQSEQRLEAARKAVLEQKQRINERAFARARRIMWFPRWGGFVIIPVGVAYTFPWKLPSFNQAAFQYTIGLILVVIFVLAVVNTIWGTSWAGLMHKWEANLAEMFERRIRWHAGVEADANAHAGEDP